MTPPDDDDHDCGWKAYAKAQDKKLAALMSRIEDLERRTKGHKTEKRKATKLPPPVAPTKPSPDQTARKRAAAAELRDARLETELTPIPVPTAERTCSACGNEKLRAVGPGKLSSVIEYVRPHFRRRVFQRETLACRCGHMVTAPAPDRVGDKSQYAPSFVAHLVTSKCCDSIPQYRLEKAYQRLGITISRSTMCDLFHRAATELEPIYRAALALVPAAADVHADETSIRQQGLDKRAFIWGFVTPEAIVYRYAPSRSGETAKQVLGDSTGRLVVDQYTGYNAVTKPGQRVRAGCLAHARRKLFEQREHPETKEPLDLIGEIYLVERQAKAAGIVGSAAHLELRRERSRGPFAKILRWARKQRGLFEPRSGMGRAIRYLLKNFHLAKHGWLYEAGDWSKYERDKALFSPDVLAWVRATQPKAWETLTKNNGSAAGETLLKRLRDQLDQRGTLDVLRHGIDLLGLKQPLKLAEFKPALAINPDILARYAQNRLRIVRQVRYSLYNENSIDLVLFLNGLPVATVELKTDFTQSINDAIDQYRFDRVPHPKGQAAEPLLSFPGGAVVHFAVSNKEVRMVTRLAGAATVFLPFNQGDDGGAGNPLNPAGGHRTAYLWEQVWARESWLEILGRYLIGKRDKTKKIVEVVFPRFHQLDVTRKLQAAVLSEGTGGRYLVQHSAGSGKTNSIAWTAHFLAELHDAQHKKVFDTILVVSDRNVIDSQLQEAIFDFERTTGVVATITNKDGSKSGKLAEALSGDKKIVVCTIQTFPFAIEAVRQLAAAQGKRFAVIADEAHSSQSGEAAKKLKAVLTQEEAAELADGGEVSAEDILAAQMSARAEDSGITFVAFTATPKNKTMELFGTRPDPTRKPAPDNVPTPFHVYSIGRRSRRASSSTCWRTTRRTAWRSSSLTRARSWTTRRSRIALPSRRSWGGFGSTPTTSRRRYRLSSSTSGPTWRRCSMAMRRRWWSLRAAWKP